MGSSGLAHAARTDTGQVRSRNEDSVRTEPGAGVFVVADGMGGHPAGDVASALAVERVCERLLDLEDGAGWEEAREALARGVADAGRRIVREGRKNPSQRGMGTTCTALLVRSGRWAVANVGDSRVYRLRDGELEQVSVDHTAYPGGSTLTRALGVTADPAPDLFEGELRAGDVFLLCSDGLMLTHPDEEIAEAMDRAADGDGGGAAEDPAVVVDEVVDEANERGAPDNVTVALVAVRDGDAGPEPEAAGETRPSMETDELEGA